MNTALTSGVLVAALVVGAAISVVACEGASSGGAGADTTGGAAGGVGAGARASETVCDKLDECNFLYGMSERECVEMVDECLEGLRPSQVEDWEMDVAFCAGKDGCQEFASCFDDVPHCFPQWGGGD